MGKLIVPIVIALENESGEIPSNFLSATIVNRHASNPLTITFSDVGDQAGTSFQLLPSEQFIFKTTGVGYDAVTVDATDSSATIVYTLA